VVVKFSNPVHPQEVEAALAGFLKKGEKALITYSVDASIIGGMVVSGRLDHGLE
jgi:F0F1-type ATP synthase delta subunit